MHLFRRLLPLAFFACAAAQAAQTYLAASADGAYVIDAQSQTAWPRCVEGMQWNGKTCTGTPRLLTYGQAQALAAERWKAEGVAWRLPRVKELQRLVDKNAQPPGLDARLFPQAPAGWHWSATANVNTRAVNPYNYGTVMRGGEGGSRLSVQEGWAVHLGTGEAQPDMARSQALPVRLVRPWP